MATLYSAQQTKLFRETRLNIGRVVSISVTNIDLGMIKYLIVIVWLIKWILVYSIGI